MKINYLKESSLKKTELLGAGCFSGDKNPKGFSGKDGEALLISSPENKKAGALLLIGLGKKEKLTLEKVRRASAKLLSQTKALRLNEASLDLGSFGGKFPVAELSSAAVEGARLSTYKFDKYKSKSKPDASKKTMALDLFSKAERTSAIQQAISEAEIICEGVYFTRDVANEPANIMTPVRLAQAAKDMARKNNLMCKVLGLNEIKRLGMGGVLGVSQGSSFPPQFVIFENKVKSKGKPIVLVGKGITFDTGGISIKPSNNMDHMKFDMCGAAAVMGAMKAIANIKLPIKVIGLTPICENMPGSKAQRPGDIIKCLNGKTVEVLNTDAEGRLILADALSYAKKFSPRAIIDAATLTGACAATFGDVCSGLMSTDPELAKRIKEAGEMTGERVWELPLWEEYGEMIKATYADIQNISKKSSGIMTSGMFLKEFADHTESWAHLDIAGTAWNEGGPKPLSPIGATGVGVRLFVRLVKSYLGR